ncbi:MAG: hypothetical protein MJZ38_00185 [archaeon]|nr:hypothetical protein [archaeon]
MITLHDPTHLYEGTISDRTRRIARIVSVVTQPQVISIILYAIVCLVCDSLTEFLTMYGICVFFGCIFPIIEVLFYSKKFHNEDGDIAKKEDRFMPLLLGDISYVLGAVALWLADAPRLIFALMVCYVLVTFSFLLISPYWKISLHAVGTVGVNMAISVAFFPWGLLLYLMLPMICWARYVLRKHTPAQLVAGAVDGLVITGLVLFLMLP